jgi:proteic killer suppression protein
MIVRFEKEYLLELYTTGKYRGKKYRFQPIIIKNYIKRIDTLIAASQIEDLFPLNSLNYEVLEGDKKGVSAIRINDQYRLEFVVSTDTTTEPVITICSIVDITKHYI